jgi:transcriptional regulator with XRE-family HTH domain
MKIKSFAKLAEEAKKRDAYWVADAIYTFTEELHNQAENMNVSRAELARRLGVSPAYITKLFRGNGNYTVETMVRLARAVGASLHLHLAPEAPEVPWSRIEAFPGIITARYENVSAPKVEVCRWQKALPADEYYSVSTPKVMEEKNDLRAPAA